MPTVPTSSFCRRPTNVQISTLTPNLGMVELQLSPNDLEVLSKLGQPLTQGLSTYDYSLLTNPSMGQELSTIINLLNRDSSQGKNNVQQIDTIQSPQATLYKTPAANVVVFPPEQDSKSRDGVIKSSSSLFVFPPTPKTAKEETLHLVTNANIEYSSHSPRAFITEYPSSIKLSQEDVFTDDPFISPECEVSLNELNTSLSNDDCEEPLVRLSKDNQCCAIQPVDEDWNSWKEPSYIDRMSSLVNCIASEPTDSRNTNAGKKKKSRRRNVGTKTVKPFLVSIPFVKLITSRQARKYNWKN